MTSFVSVFYFDLTASNWFFFFRIIGTHIQCVLYAVNFVNMHCNRNIRSSDDERTNPIQNCNKCHFPSILCTSVGINLHTLVPGNVFFVNLVQFRKKVGTHESALIIPEHTKKIRKYEVLIGHLIIWHICLNLLTAIAVTIIKEWPKITLTEKKKSLQTKEPGNVTCLVSFNMLKVALTKTHIKYIIA